ncbi:YceI family protein [Tamlana sp. I1]|uniref:YceI family protein n=1 Tax=Tamlana sp. I1 TaxID=2762061 RepID=UPI001890821B|nr:YceI family protein [Tamlana sp. I1]
MKKVLFLVLMCTVFGFTTRDTNVESTAFKVAPESTLSVVGTSNVKGFECDYNFIEFKSPIPVYYHIEGHKIKFTNSALVLNNINFDCGGKGINRDFKDIIKTKKHPHIRLILKEIENYKKQNNVQVVVDITMAGVTNTYKVPIVFNKTEKLEVIGNLNLLLDDFNIETPSKLFGLVKIDNHVEIAFKLFLEEV